MGELLAPYRTPYGWLHAEGFAARAGILEYRLADGSVRRELVTPAALVDSLASLAGAPIADDHPADLITADSAASLRKGFIHRDIEAAGGFAKIRVTIHDGETVSKVLNGKRELSVGKVVALDERSGLWDDKAQAYLLDGETEPRYYPPDVEPAVLFDSARAQRFDAIQAKIHNNHVAVVHRGRAGSEAGLRLDDAGHILPVADPRQPRDGAGPNLRRDGMDVVQIRFDGDISFPAASDLAQAVQGERQRHNDEVATLKSKADELQKKLDAAMAEAEGAEETEEQKKKRLEEEAEKLKAFEKAKSDAETAQAKADEHKAQLDAIPSLEAVFDAVRVAREYKLHEGAEGLKLDSLKADGAQLIQLRRAALKMARPKEAARIDGYTPAEVVARFDAFVETFSPGAGAPAVEKALIGDGKPPADDAAFKQKMDSAERDYMQSLQGKPTQSGAGAAA